MAKDAQSSSRQPADKWISAAGWLLCLGGGVGVILGFSDLQNLTAILVVGVVMIAVGILLIANSRILRGLAAIERNTRVSAQSAQAQNPAAPNQARKQSEDEHAETTTSL